MSKTVVVLCALVVIAVASPGCNSEVALVQLSAEQRFELGMKKFSDESYLEAIEEFRIVALQHQGSAFADDAQYMLGESHFFREEYVLAAYEYEVLLRAMPTSEFAPRSRSKRALCFYNLSPRSYLDQEYTRKAIDEFQAFIEYHPTDSLVTVAEVKIAELNIKLANKEYLNGITYLNLEYYKSAIFYFDIVLEKYHDTPVAEPALLKKAQTLVLRRRYDEAKTEINKFFARYPKSSLQDEAERLRAEILLKQSENDGKQGEASKNVNAAQARKNSN